MQAIVERDVSAPAPRRRVVIQAITHETLTPYRAPLATFLALVASARASATRSEGQRPLDAEAGACLLSRN